MKNSAMSASTTAAAGRSTVDWATLVTFTVGSDLLAAPVEMVERVLRGNTPSVLTQMPPFVDGVITYGGRMVTVVDLRRRFGRANVEMSAATRVIVFAVARDWLAALVDSVQDVIRVDATSIAAPPDELRGLRGEYLLGLAERNDREVLILDMGKLLCSTEAVALHEAQPDAQPDAQP